MKISNSMSFMGELCATEATINKSIKTSNGKREKMNEEKPGEKI